MKKIALTFFTKSFLLIVLLVGSSDFSKAQSYHSATDSVAPPYAVPQAAGWSGGFLFTPYQDLYVVKLGKLVPDSGSYRWTIWDASTEQRIYQQDNHLNTPGQYSYEPIDKEKALVLKLGKSYVLQLSTNDAVPLYLGPIGTHYGQHLNVIQARNCFSGCNNNVHAFPPVGNPSSFYTGVPDLLYSLEPIKRGFNDATVIMVDSLTNFCAGQKNIYATIGNYGLNQLDSVEIHWEINGVPQTVVRHRQLLDTLNGNNPSTPTILLGSHLFAAGDPDTIKVWTALPNGHVDTVIYGDTLSVIWKAGLAGNYTLNANLPTGNGNYQSFSDLAFDLHTFGVCSAVNVSVNPGTYNESLYLEDIPGASAVNTISIDGQDSTMTILTHDGMSNYATVTFDGVKYVKLKNMKVMCTNTTKAVNILFANSADHNTVSNCYLKGSMAGTNTNFVNVLFSSSTTLNKDGADADFNTISNNRIEGGTYGIKIVGSSSRLNVGNRMLNNVIDSVYSYGMYLFYQDSLKVTGNQVNAVSRGNLDGDGVFISYSENVLLNKNYIYANDYGVNFNFNRSSEISNNMLVSESAYFSSNSYGLNVSGDSINIFNNSISVKKIATAININGGYDYDVRNNIFSAEHGPALAFNLSFSSFHYMDHNIFYTKEGPVLIDFAAILFPDLSSFQSYNTTYNASSLEMEPQFNSPTDLHIIGATAYDKGANLPNIQEDIDGDLRPMSGSSFTDIGADEYTPPSCSPPVDLAAFNPSLDSITLEWQAGSLSPLGYQVEIVRADSLQGSGDTIYTSVESLRIGGLDSATHYEFYVRQICGRNDTSVWWGPAEFYTADLMPYSEDFENSSFGEFAHNWGSTTFDLPRWNTDTTSPLGAVEDHTQTQGSGGMFAYFDINFSPGSSELLSPFIYTDTNKIVKLSFWYHMYGTDMGDLNVYIDTNGVSNMVATISGQKQLNRTDPWIEYSTYLYGYDEKYIQIRFEGVKGSGPYSSIGIDDVSLDTIPLVNAGVIALKNTQSTICPGTFTPIVDVKNIGSVSIDSVEVFWDLNGVLDSTMISSTILPGDTSSISLNNMTFNNNALYDLKIYTQNPNSIADPVRADDTLKLILRTGLSGNYTIDTSLPVSGSNFHSISSAANALNTYGMCGAVNFDIAAGTYNEAVLLEEIDGANSINTITFDGQDSSATIITHNGSTAFATWILDGTDYVRLKNMQIEYTDSTEGAALLFAKDATFNVITNSVLEVDTNSIQTELFNIIYSGSSLTNLNGATADSNIISGNVLNGGYYGVWINGTNTRDIMGNQILNNKIRNTYHAGIHSSYQDSVDIKGNEIRMRSGSGRSSYGIYLYSTSNLQLEGNYVHSEGYGVYIYGYNKSNDTAGIINNMLVSENHYGLYMRDIESATIVHNSIQVRGTSPAVDLNSLSSVILSNYDVRNNIFSASNSAALETDHPHSMFAFFDHNTFYTKGTRLLNIDNAGYSDLSAYQAAFPGFNINSIEGDPQFASTIDLHIVGSVVDGKGDNSVGISKDIDGDIRPFPGSTTVDIGADEFDPPLCPPVYKLSAFNASPDSVSLQWFGGSGTFQYEIVLRDSAQGTGMANITALDSLRVGGLTPNTDYDYYVREICGRNDTSIWWGPVAFNTPQAVNDLSIDRLISPTKIAQDSCIASTTSNIVLSIVNQGNMYIDFTQDTTDVSLDVSGAVVQSYSYQLNNNSLNAGNPLGPNDTIVITIGTLNMTNIGLYNILAFLELGIDSKNTNDTLLEVINNKMSGGVLSASANLVCDTGKVMISTIGSFGKIQWQRMVNGVFIDETNADSTSYEVFIDSTTTFRAVACGTEYSDTVTIESISLDQPIAFDSMLVVSCGDTGTVALVATSINPNAVFEWFDVPTAGTALIPGGNITSISQNGDTLYYRNTSVDPNSPTVDTFYVQEVVSSSSGTCTSVRDTAIASIDCLVGIDEAESGFAKISIQPNPSKGIFHIVGNKVMGEVEISIFNTNGKLVYQSADKLKNNFDERINISGLAKGVYYIKLQGKKSFEMRKIVIN